MPKNIIPRLIPALVAVAFSGAASASGFQLQEQNASGLGAAYAGSAAIAEDASTVFWNPAGMAYLPSGKMQVVGAVNFVKPSADFTDGGSIMPAGIYNRGGNGGDAGGWAVVPSMYFVLPLNEQISLGLAINAPFGLKTEYDADWVGRFRAIKSEVKTININPSISFKVNEMVSLGLGLTASRLEGTFSNAVNASGALCAGLGAALCAPNGALRNLEGVGTIEGDDWGYGWNLGMIFQPSSQTRIGASYRSAIQYHLSGNVNFSRPTVTSLPSAGLNAGANAALAAGLYNGQIASDVKLPDTATLSAWQQIGERWEVMGDISWTGWAKIQELRFSRTDGVAAGTTLSKTDENWRNTWRVAVGGAYKFSDEWKMRAGIAYDQSPVDSADYRTPRLPDNNRTWLTLGAQYKPTKDLWFDAGYAYIFVQDSRINDSGGREATQAQNVAAYGFLKGSYQNNVNVIGLQATYNF